MLPKDAIDWFRSRVPLRMKTIEGIVKRARRKAAGATKQLINQTRQLIEQELADSLRTGSTLRDFQNRVPDILDAQGLTAANPARVETIYRTNMNGAYNAGRIAQIEATPALRETFAWLQYNAIMDSRVRPAHAAMNGRVYRRDDPVWNKWMPPNGYNCRCGVTPVAKEDIEDEGLIVRRSVPKVDGNPVQPDTGFRLNSAKAFAKGGLEGLDEDAKREAKALIV